MALLPNASVKTKVDITRSRFEWKRQYQVAPTCNLLEEGSVLQRVPDAAALAEVVDLTATTLGPPAQRPVGISLQSRISAYTFTKCQEVVVPHVAPFTVQLAETNLVSPGVGLAEASAYDVTGAAWLNPIAIPGPPVPPVTHYMIDPLTGLVTFDASLADAVVRVTYRYNLTAIERDLLLRQSHVNRGAEDIFGLITVAVGHCVVYTTMYDATGQYVPGMALQVAAGGIFMPAPAIPTSALFGTVISAPTPSDPFLGVEYVTMP